MSVRVLTKRSAYHVQHPCGDRLAPHLKRSPNFATDFHVNDVHFWLPRPGLKLLSRRAAWGSGVYLVLSDFGLHYALDRG